MKVVQAEPLVHAEPVVLADGVHHPEPLVHEEMAVLADRVLHPDPEAQADPVSACFPGSGAWLRSYLRRLLVADCPCALTAGVLAVEIRFVSQGYLPLAYLAFTGVLPALWWGSVMLAGGYDPRFIGLGSDEFRKVL